MPSLVQREQLLLSTPFAKPRTPTEIRIAEIWAQVLSMDRVGVDDRYQDLGGDSLLAANIFAAMAGEFRIEIPMAVLAEAATVAALAKKIDGLIAAEGSQ